MLKGKTLIELKDVKTGNVERYEDENIITDAAQLYTSALSTMYSIDTLGNNANNYTPLWNSTFGGIKLFEKAIEEVASNWHIPSVGQNKIIGYASMDTSDGSDNKRGSRNIEETIALENGVQIVWDFATSEANGIISCVCLTSGEGGKYPYGSFTEGNSGIWKVSENGVGFDRNEKMFLTSSSNKLKKYGFYLDKLPFDKNIGKGTLADEKNFTNQISPRTETGNDFLAYVYCSGNSSGDASVSIYKMDKSTGETSTIELSLSDVQAAAKNTDYSNHRVIDGYLYLEAYTRDAYYQVDLSNTSNIKKINLPANTDEPAKSFIFRLPNGDLATNMAVFDPVNGNVEILPKTGLYYVYSSGSYNKAFITSIEEIDGFAAFMVRDYGGSMRVPVKPNPLMLHSINNLDTPVTKTADKTMKITYTLTYTQ